MAGMRILASRALEVLWTVSARDNAGIWTIKGHSLGHFHREQSGFHDRNCSDRSVSRPLPNGAWNCVAQEFLSAIFGKEREGCSGSDCSCNPSGFVLRLLVDKE